MNRPIVLCVGEHWSSAYVYHAIRNLGVTHVIMEKGPSPFEAESSHDLLLDVLMKRISPVMKWMSRRRIAELKERYPLKDEPIPMHHILKVTSLNDARTKMWLDRLMPELLIFHETGPIDPDVLNRMDCPVLTIRPSMAAGQLEAYWALRANPDICEVRIEQWTEQGWDIRDRSLLYLGGTDNFVTYPYLQLSVALPLLRCQIEQMLQPAKQERRRIE
ncbi:MULTISPECIES: hypothetical protein [Exiguobacterium]|uniref:hypothetical protein n=1 Tax=Exiguobacterium TaxID=33986 RepID=UPI001BE77DD5|nr:MULTISPECIES: hypothetical protein [Exiguobacterium]MCT4783173.1 hypothetical protein [Exiguobacterium himgiriensis]